MAERVLPFLSKKRNLFQSVEKKLLIDKGPLTGGDFLPRRGLERCGQFGTEKEGFHAENLTERRGDKISKLCFRHDESARKGGIR